MLMKGLRLNDIWRTLNPGCKEYTFFSHRHRTWSRIDYFLISNSLTENVLGCSIGAISLTDHAMVDLQLNIYQKQNKSSRWRLNLTLLDEEQNQKAIADKLQLFFKDNLGSTERIATVWEASKAFIRGTMIAIASKKKKEDKVKLEQLEQQILELEKSLENNYSEAKMQQMIELKS